MNFEVVWDIVAYRKLEQIWDAAADLGPAVNAFDEIERRLADNPQSQGESRPRGRRLLIVSPLGVVFRVQPRLKEVYVLDVWTFSSRNP